MGKYTHPAEFCVSSKTPPKLIAGKSAFPMNGPAEIFLDSVEKYIERPDAARGEFF